MIALTKEIMKLVSFDIDNQMISGSSIYTKSVPVSRDDWEVAIVTLWNKYQSQNTETVRRMSAMLVLTNDSAEAHSQASYTQTDLVYPYPMTIYYYITNHRYAGFSYAKDAKLSEVGYDTNGGRARIEKGRINGSNVEIEFRNLMPYNCYLRIEGRIKLIKVVKV